VEVPVAQLAMLLARYDRSVARTVLEPLARRMRSQDSISQGNWVSHTLIAATAIDPNRAVELINYLPDDPPGAVRKPKDDARLMVADVLAHVGPGLWDYLQTRYAYLQGDSRDDER
jgi:hypothetical protein